MVCTKCSKEFSNPMEIAKCVECKAEYHTGCCCIRTAAKLKALVTSGAGWKCEDCHQDSTSIGIKSETEDFSMLNTLKSIQKQMKQDSEQFKLSFTSLNQSMSKVESSLAAVVARLTVLEDENNKFREECEELSPGPVFGNEHLTLHTKDLLWRCKTKVKDGSLAYAWCTDSKSS
ncbi:hypothetical protein J6590_056863 [Homalodisca vitripennis]|nr:hypothetical protein J6590_056863 [Homalodisca vitripennis]